MKFTTEIRQHNKNEWYYEVEFTECCNSETEYVIRKFPYEKYMDSICGFKPTLEEAECRLNEILESIKKYSTEYNSNSKKTRKRTKKRWYILKNNKLKKLFKIFKGD